MNLLVYVVAEATPYGQHRLSHNARGRMMVFETAGRAMTAAKLRAASVRKGSRSHDAVAWRVIPFSAEGTLFDVWDDYEHTEVRL